MNLADDDQTFLIKLNQYQIESRYPEDIDKLYKITDKELTEEYLNKITQIDVPDRSFAYIDHHPGTERSIPKKVLEMLERRDILVVQNPRNEPLASTLALMDSAAELHLVNSAPLCMALTLDARSLKKIHYDSRNDPATKSYSNWESVTILTNQPREGAAQLLRMRQNAKVISILKNKLESTLKIGKFEERVN